MGKKNEHINFDQLGREYPFHAPEGYFDNLSQKVMARLEGQSQPKKNFFSIRYVKPAIAIAAGFLIIVALFNVPSKLISPGKSSSSQSLSKLTDEELFISDPLSDHNIFEALESTVPDDTFDSDQLETVLLASVSEYELIDINN
jgi:hypothetical protein